ncbi:DUF3291 domain-containing protein [Aquimarina addita]
MMLFMLRPLSKVSGQSFFKLMGSGKEGFKITPDWGVYALLQVWNTEKEADDFFENSKIMSRFRSKTVETWSVYLKSFSAKGKWSGKQPFEKSGALCNNRKQIAVITRATIKTHMLYKFWKYVPTSQAPLSLSDGLLFTKGVGEAPVFQMATFSVWRDKEALMEYAYKSPEHKEAIIKTKKFAWYKEELFSRFQPFKSLGTWGGKDPLNNTD